MAQYSILIIEDSLDARRLLMAYLSTLDYDLKINLVPSAEEAFLIAGQEKIDLLVSDYMLPGMTGADLVRWMRKRFPTVRVMMVTALDKADVALEVAELQIDSFLKKPLDMGEFTAAVEKSLRLAGAPEPPPKKPTSPIGSTSSKISATVKTGELHTEPPNVQPQHTRLLDNPAPEPAATSQFNPSPSLQPKPADAPQSYSLYIPPNQATIPQSTPPPYISPSPTTGPLPYISPSPQASPMPVAQSIPPVERDAETVKETPAAEPSSKASAASLIKFLDQILYSLPAETVFVLDGSGRIQSQVGEIPGGLAFEIWLPVIAKAINESTKLHTLSPGLRETGLLYRAERYEMIVAILNGYALVVVIKATQSNSRLWMALSQAMEAHSSLSLMLEKAPLKANPTQPIAPVMQSIPPIPPSTPRQPNKTALLSENSVNEMEFKKTLERAAREMTREQAEKFWRERRKTGQLPGGRTPAETPKDPDEGN